MFNNIFNSILYKNNSKKTLKKTIYLEDKIFEKLEKLNKKYDISISFIINIMIDEYLKSNNL